MKRPANPAPPAFAQELVWNGFVHIRCDCCGTDTTTCLREPTNVFRCRLCGYTTALEEKTRAFTYCECGFNGRYSTNITSDEIMDIPCFVCGMPNTVEYHIKKGRGRYIPVQQTATRTKGRNNRRGK